MRRELWVTPFSSKKTPLLSSKHAVFSARLASQATAGVPPIESVSGAPLGMSDVAGESRSSWSARHEGGDASLHASRGTVATIRGAVQTPPTHVVPDTHSSVDMHC